MFTEKKVKLLIGLLTPGQKEELLLILHTLNDLDDLPTIGDDPVQVLTGE